MDANDIIGELVENVSEAAVISDVANQNRNDQKMQYAVYKHVKEL